MRPYNLPKIEVDYDSIPAFRKEALGRALLNGVRRELAKPGARERYEAWLKEYEKEQREAARAAK